MPYTPILATLGYVLSPDGENVLLIHRNARPDDYAYGKYNGLGGKIERDEDMAAGMMREIEEEAGIVPTRMQFRGTLSWPGFGKKGEDWLAFVFIVREWTGTPNLSNHEGTLEWVPLSLLLRFELNLWPGDKHFLPLVFDEDAQPFHGVMPYENGQPVHWRYSR